MINLLTIVISSAFRSFIPLVLASLGGAFSSRAGVSDLGLEGMMLFGAFFGAFGSYISGNAWVGIMFGICFGALSSLLHGLMHISFKVNASISGMCVNLLASATTPILLYSVFGQMGKSSRVAGFGKVRIEFLQGIPVIGAIVNSQSIFFYLTILIVIVSWFVFFKTKFGLRLRMVGENPSAASTVGLKVNAYKYFGVAMSGALAGLAGAYLSLAQMDLFVEEMTNGRGYIAVVIDEFGGFNPVGILLGSLFFGFFDSLQTLFQSSLPSQLVMATPYVLTMLVIVINSARNDGMSRKPAGIGKFADSN